MADDDLSPDWMAWLSHPFNHGVMDGRSVDDGIVTLRNRIVLKKSIVARFVEERLFAEDHGLNGDENLEHRRLIGYPRLAGKSAEEREAH